MDSNLKKRKNWGWIYLVMFAFLLAAIYFKKNSLGQIALVSLAGAILYVQLSRGYALNRQGTEAISRTAHPVAYWFIISLNIVLLLFFIIEPLIPQ